MLYTLSYWKKENLKVSSVTLFWLRDSSSQVPRVMSCLFSFTWLFFCSFVFVISSNETLKSQNLFKPETLSRVYVTVTNSTNTPRAYCITFVDPTLLQKACVKFPSKPSKIDYDILALFAISRERFFQRCSVVLFSKNRKTGGTC